MSNFGADRLRDEVLLVSRLMLVLLYAVFGWSKLFDYAGAVGYMTHVGAPLPGVAAVVSIVAECGGALAIALGVLTRPIALLMALYTLGTALIGHAFWAEEGAARYGDAINFYKNISITAGFLLLYVAGPGRYALDTCLCRSCKHRSDGAEPG